MVAAGDICINRGFFQLVVETFRGDEVVDAPSGVVLAGFEAVAPPRIDTRYIGIKVAPRVGKAGSQQIGHLLPFLVGEAGVVVVGLGIFQVDFFVGNVQVTAEDDWLFLIESGQVGPEIVFPLHAVIEAGQFALAVGGIAGDEVERVEFEGDEPPFMVVFVHAHAVVDRQGMEAAEDGRTAVALAVGVIPVLFIPGQVHVYLAGLQLRFLQGEDIGVELVEYIHKSFFHDSAQTVYIPGNTFHEILSFLCNEAIIFVHSLL